MWLILQQKKPDDFVIATGQNYSVREFILKSFETLGIEIGFKGKGKNEVGYISKLKKSIKHLKVNDEIIKVDPIYYRPSEVDTLLGDSSKARKILKWKPEYNFDDLVKEMIEQDLLIARKEKLIKDI